MNGGNGVAQVAVAEPLEVVLATYKELLDQWPFVLQGLRRVKADLEGHSFWEPEHIRQALMQSFKAAAKGEEAGTELWLVQREGGVVVGFAVTQTTYDPFVHVPLCLFVWIAYKDREYPGDVVGAACGQLEAVARVRGYRWLECMTAIPQFAAHLERHGWETELVVLRKAVYPATAPSGTQH